MTKVETKRIEPPESLTAPRDLPGPPRVPEGGLENQDVIDWYETWVQELQKVFLAAEEDKRSIREWAESGREVQGEP